MAAGPCSGTWDRFVRVQGSNGLTQEMGKAILGPSVGLHQETQARKEDSRAGNTGNLITPWPVHGLMGSLQRCRVSLAPLALEIPSLELGQLQTPGAEPFPLHMSPPRWALVTTPCG